MEALTPCDCSPSNAFKNHNFDCKGNSFQNTVMCKQEVIEDESKQVDLKQNFVTIEVPSIVIKREVDEFESYSKDVCEETKRVEIKIEYDNDNTVPLSTPNNHNDDKTKIKIEFDQHYTVPINTNNKIAVNNNQTIQVEEEEYVKQINKIDIEEVKIEVGGSDVSHTWSTQTVDLFKCNICATTFNKKHKLNKHKSEVHPELKCHICMKIFKTRGNLNQHVTVTHKKAADIQCNLCTKMFKSNWNLKLHIRAHTSKEIYICDYCNRSYKLKKYLLDHILSAHLIKDLHKCMYCSKTFSSRGSLCRHYECLHSNTLTKCDFCNKQYKSKRYLKRHFCKNKSPVMKNFICDYCKKGFASREYVRLHILQAHLYKNYFKCIDCLKSFSSKGSLRRHRECLHENTIMICNVCNKTYKSKRYLNSHLCKSPHFKQFICDYCNKEFTSKKYIRYHITNTHMVQPRFKCELCYTTFSQKYNLNAHKQKFH